jgi:Sulfatase
LGLITTPQPVRRTHKDWAFAALAFLTLVTFVVAESVYEILASNREFLGVRQVGNPRLLEIVLAFNLLPALALMVLWGLCRLIHRRLAQTFMAAVCGLFVLAFGLQLDTRYLARSEFFTIHYASWLIPAALAAYLSGRYEKPFRSFVLAISPGIVIFPALFLYRTWTPAKKIAPPSQVAQPQAAQAGHTTLPPIFLLIFDEFRFHDLLGPDGQIDGTLFPNFRQLADDSTWFRNATANADETNLSIPVILTGNYPVGVDPSYQAYPHNLLTLLQPYYHVTVHERVTHFCIEGRYHCPDAEIASSDLALLRDVLVIYTAGVLPKPYAASLPPMARSWGPFRDYTEEMAARIARFRAFLNSLGAIPGDRSMVMMHQELPHSPYVLTSQGTIYKADPSYVDPSFVGNVDLLDALHKRYVMQMGYVDKEVGEFIGRLKQLGLYNKSLIIITADHGVSFRPDDPGRVLNRADADEILPVPLFIKTPFQDHGVVSDRDVQLIDLVPTVAGLLGLKVPWPVTGRSIFDPEPAPRMKIAYSTANPGMRLVFPATLASGEQGSPAPTRKSPLVGQDVATFDVDQVPEIAGSLDPLPFSIIETGRGQKETPVNAFGWAAYKDSAEVPQIAVAVNGEIVAVTPPCCERRDVAGLYRLPQFLKSGWRISFSSRKLHVGVNAVTAYVVLDEKKRSLAILTPSMPDIIHGVRPNRAEAIEAAGLIGIQVEKCAIAPPDVVKGSLDTVGKTYVQVRPGIDVFPIEVAGWAVRPGTPAKQVEVVVALDGAIVAAVPLSFERPDVEKAFHDSKFRLSGWTARFSSRKLRSGKNQIDAYVVLDAKKKSLAPLPAVDSTIAVKFE